MSALVHPFPFSPSYGYTLEQLLRIGVPASPPDFVEFWQNRYQAALSVDPKPALIDTGKVHKGLRVHDLSYRSTGETKIGGWALLPESGKIERAFVILHGYGGREAPDFHLPFDGNAALFFPCARGISRSRTAGIPSDPSRHVLLDIDDPAKYVVGGCVDDVWLAVSAAETLFPQVKNRIGLLGISFGGGIGTMALAADQRIARAHFNVPTFGNQTLRLTLETVGSGAAVKAQHRKTPEIVERTLQYYDAATAAQHVKVPVHYACALFDPMVAPPGQFAIHNATPTEKELFVLRAGHFDYPEQHAQNVALLREIHRFFQAV